MDRADEYRDRVGKPVPESEQGVRTKFIQRDMRTPLWVQRGLVGWASVASALAVTASIFILVQQSDTTLLVLSIIALTLLSAYFLANVVFWFRWNWMWMTTTILPPTRYGEDLEDFEVGLIAAESSALFNRSSQHRSAINQHITDAYYDLDS